MLSKIKNYLWPKKIEPSFKNEQFEYYSKVLLNILYSRLVQNSTTLYLYNILKPSYLPKYYEIEGTSTIVYVDDEIEDFIILKGFTINKQNTNNRIIIEYNANRK